MYKECRGLYVKRGEGWNERQGDGGKVCVGSTLGRMLEVDMIMMMGLTQNIL